MESNRSKPVSLTSDLDSKFANFSLFMQYLKKINPDSNFTLIELMVAFVILIIGFQSFTALFSTSLSTSQTSVGQTSATDAVEQFLYYASNEIKNDWVSWSQAFPSTKSDWNDSWLGWSENPIYDIGNVKIEFPSDLLTATFDPTIDQDGIFRVQHLTYNGAADYSAVMRVWKYEEISESKLILYAETSWPAEKPYSERSKETYSIDIYVPLKVELASGERSGGKVTKVDENGVTVELSEVLQGSRIITFKMTNVGATNGDIDRFAISCNSSNLSSHSASSGFSTSSGYDLSSGINGVVISGNSGNTLENGEVLTCTYKLEVDSVPDTSIATNAGGNVEILVFTQDDFDYVYENRDDTTSTITFEQTASDADEASNNVVTISVELIVPSNGILSEDVVVNFAAASSSTASSDADYTFGSSDQADASNFLTFDQGSNSGTVKYLQVYISQDANVEDEEIIDIQLSIAGGPATGGILTEHRISIADDDIAVLSFQSQESTTEGEGIESFEVPIELYIENDGILEKDISVSVIDLANGTAESTIDYSYLGDSSISSVTISSGAASGHTIPYSLKILEDGETEGDETVKLEIDMTEDNSQSLGNQTTHTLTIKDNDVFEEAGIRVNFGCDYVDISNTNSVAIELVSLKYFGESSFSGIQEIHIDQDQTTTINADAGQKIEEVGVAVNRENAIRFTADSDCGISSTGDFMYIFDCQKIYLKYKSDDGGAIKRVKFKYYNLDDTWSQFISQNIVKSDGFVTVSSQLGNIITEVKISKNSSGSGWSYASSNINCDALIAQIEASQGSVCQDIVSNVRFYKDNDQCYYKFYLDRVEIENDASGPIVQAQLKYNDSNTWYSANPSSEITSSSGPQSIYGAVNKKIYKIRFKREYAGRLTDWIREITDASLCDI